MFVAKILMDSNLTYNYVKMFIEHKLNQLGACMQSSITLERTNHSKEDPPFLSWLVHHKQTWLNASNAKKYQNGWERGYFSLSEETAPSSTTYKYYMKVIMNQGKFSMQCRCKFSGWIPCHALESLRFPLINYCTIAIWDIVRWGG